MTSLVRWTGETPAVRYAVAEMDSDGIKRRQVENVVEDKQNHYNDRICQIILSLLNFKDSSRLSLANRYWKRGFEEHVVAAFEDRENDSRQSLGILEWLLAIDKRSSSFLNQPTLNKCVFTAIAHCFQSLASTQERKNGVLECLNRGIAKEKEVLEEFQYDDESILAEESICERWTQLKGLTKSLNSLDNVSIRQMLQSFIELIYKFGLSINPEYRGEAVLFAIETQKILLLKLLILTGSISQEAKESALQRLDFSEAGLLYTQPLKFSEEERCACEQEEKTRRIVSSNPSGHSLIEKLGHDLLPQLIFPWLDVKEGINLSLISRGVWEINREYQKDILMSLGCLICLSPLFEASAGLDRDVFVSKAFSEAGRILKKCYGDKEGKEQFVQIMKSASREEERVISDDFPADVKRLFEERWQRLSIAVSEVESNLDTLSADNVLHTYKNILIPFLKNLDSEYRGTAAIAAAASGNFELLKLLLASGKISMDARGLALVEIAKGPIENAEMVQLILASGKIEEGELLDDREKKIENGQPLGEQLDESIRSLAVFEAAKKGYTTTIEVLLDSVTLLDFDNYMINALSQAVQQNNIEIYDVLLSKGFWIDGVLQESLIEMQKLGRKEMIAACFSPKKTLKRKKALTRS